MFDKTKERYNAEKEKAREKGAHAGVLAKSGSPTYFQGEAIVAGLDTTNELLAGIIELLEKQQS